MKRILITSALLTSIFAGTACLAADNSDQKASDDSGKSALEVISLPVSLGAVAAVSGTATTIGAAHQLIKLVDAAGNGLSELKADGLDQINNMLTPPDPRTRVEKDTSSNHKAIFQKKEIPLVVRSEYVELNEPVKVK